MIIAFSKHWKLLSQFQQWVSCYTYCYCTPASSTVGTDRPTGTVQLNIVALIGILLKTWELPLLLRSFALIMVVVSWNSSHYFCFLFLVTRQCKFWSKDSNETLISFFFDISYNKKDPKKTNICNRIDPLYILKSLFNILVFVQKKLINYVSEVCCHSTIDSVWRPPQATYLAHQRPWLWASLLLLRCLGGGMFMGTSDGWPVVIFLP